jgi:hypothetical protein
VKLAMTLLVKNEIEIIGANIDFHREAGIDHFVIMDNASDDGTRDVLNDYEKSSDVTVLDERGNDYSQHRWVTRMAHMARDLGADWVIPNDADEFWVSGRGNLKQAIRSTGSPLQICKRLNMVYPYDRENRKHWWERAVFRATPPIPFAVPENPLADPLPGPYFMLDLPPKALMACKGLVSISQGNHSAVFEGQVEPQDAKIRIYHFPVRSAQQFESKVRQGGAAYGRNVELPQRVGWHWRRWYRMLTEEGLEAVLADALPNFASLQAGLRCGSICEDPYMRQAMAANCVT